MLSSRRQLRIAVEPLSTHFGASFPRSGRASGPVAAYAVAILIVIAAIVVRRVLEPWLGTNAPYLLFFPAILVASWYGGFGPGAVATALSSVAAMDLYLPPIGLAIDSSTDGVPLVLFVTTGLAIAALNGRVRRTEEAHRAEAALSRARAEKLDAIINTTVDGIIVIDATGVVEEFNRGAERLFGFPAREVVGRNVSVLMPSPEHEDHDAYIQRYFATGDARIIGTGREVTGRRRDGSTFPLHLSVGEMEIGGERKFTGLLHDLTKRRQFEARWKASEALWRAVIDAAVDAIIVIDVHGRIEVFNPGAARLFGYSEEDVVGQNVNMLMPSPYREEHDTYMARYLATGQAKIIGKGREVTARRKDGTTFPVHLSVAQITVAGERKFTGILHDLTQRVRMEEQLREQAALAHLGEMAAVIAHEVKNPLAGIRGAIQVLASRMAKDKAESPIVPEIIARIDALDGMMKELLLFARTPRLKLMPTDVTRLVSSTADLLTRDPALQALEVQITGAAPAILGDPEMLKIVFQNLLLNGAHAMHGRGRIQISVGAANAMSEVVIRDEGPGIPADVRDKIFTPFFTTKSRGSGLGLPTAKRIVDAHRGEIVIDCPPDGGTRVVVRLPVEPSAAAVEATGSSV
jgi:PAS domain S-box-containing protein